MPDKSKEPTLAEELLPFYRGIVESEGCRRLSVALGGLCALIVATVVLIASRATPPWDIFTWGRFALILAITFAVPWTLTQVIGWVIEGFSHGRLEGKKPGAGLAQERGRIVIPDFKGHHFEKTSKSDQQPERHRCERCGMLADVASDGSVDFSDGTGVTTGITPGVPLESSHISRCK